MATKHCAKCDLDKEAEDFPRRSGTSDGRDWTCQPCKSESLVSWQRRNRPSVAIHHRNAQLKRYGLTRADYDELLAKQGGCCAICRRPDNLPFNNFAVDHDHATNEVRGLLCQRCNRTLGLAGDSAALLSAAANYLTLTPVPTP